MNQVCSFCGLGMFLSQSFILFTAYLRRVSVGFSGIMHGNSRNPKTLLTGLKVLLYWDIRTIKSCDSGVDVCGQINKVFGICVHFSFLYVCMEYKDDGQSSEGHVPLVRQKAWHVQGLVQSDGCRVLSESE